MFNNVSNTDFSELKEYTEAKMKITLKEFFMMGDSEVNTYDIDYKMENVKLMGE